MILFIVLNFVIKIDQYIYSIILVMVNINTAIETIKIQYNKFY